MRLLSLGSLLGIAYQAFTCLAATADVGLSSRAPEQDIVTWDGKSLLINGERVMILSGEFHPFRLPVPSLWPDVLQKIKALGFNCVSFYVDWALLEGNPGEYRAEPPFAFEPFLEAVQEAGLYAIARPGPYINAEVSGGGFPGWLTRVRGALRSTAPDYLAATRNYFTRICEAIAKYQITNGGPVILFQPENEWTQTPNAYLPFPLGDYMQDIMDEARAAGIVVPFISNDAHPIGNNRPGTGVGEVDLYGYDSYPVLFDCANPTEWAPFSLRTDLWDLHQKWSPNTPHSILEFQGGSYDTWFGTGYDQCDELVNSDFIRVFYKNNFAQGLKILNMYMIYGGTNWGNNGDPALYTSYDYASVIKEDRTLTREKYSELKLQATFIGSSPQYLTATPRANTTSGYSNESRISVTPILGDAENSTNPSSSFFFVVKDNYTEFGDISYKIILPTSVGNVTAPQSNELTLKGRDAKLMVTDYDIAGTNLLFSTSDVFVGGSFGNTKALVLYASLGEYNEFALQDSGPIREVSKGGEYTVETEGPEGFNTIGWHTPEKKTVLTVGDVTVFLMNRKEAYRSWVLDVAGSESRIMVTGPYLVRNASLSQGVLNVSADFESSSLIEIIGAPDDLERLLINDQEVPFKSNKNGSEPFITADFDLAKLEKELPDLGTLGWKYIDTLPELQSDYDDSRWTMGSRTFTNNTLIPFWTPVSLYASDYGFHSGTIIYRGRFNSTGEEATLALWTNGGVAFSASLWLEDSFIGSSSTNLTTDNYKEVYNITVPLEAGKSYVFTVVVINNGLDHSWIGRDEIKTPRGVLGWNLLTTKGTSTPIAWKLAGNLGGEDYQDKSRGPLNEGGLYVERQGYHLPGAPISTWEDSSPFDGIQEPGIAFYAANFSLDLPSEDWDIPLSIQFSNDTATNGQYRVQLYVNGWQFGRFGHMGPQYEFPVPEGILNYHGENYIGISLWALKEEGAKIKSISLKAGTSVWTGRQEVEVVPAEKYAKRTQAF